MSSSSSSSAAAAAFDVNTVLQSALGDVSKLSDTDKATLKACTDVDLRLKGLFLRNSQLVDLFAALPSIHSITLDTCMFEPGAKAVLQKGCTQLKIASVCGHILHDKKPEGFDNAIKGMKLARELLKAETEGYSIRYTATIEAIIKRNFSPRAFHIYLEKEGFLNQLLDTAPQYCSDEDVNLLLRSKLNEGALAAFSFEYPVAEVASSCVIS